MKTALVLVVVVFCTFSALAEEKNIIKPVGSLSPAMEFSSTDAPSTEKTTLKTTVTPAPNTTTTKPKTTTIKPNTTTTTKPKTTTIKPNTTTTTPKTTTIKPNTTTTSPKTTTIKPNTTTTTPKPTTTTTPKPTTTPPKPPTPPPQPTPSTTLTVGNYNVTVNKEVCLRANMALQIRVARPQVNGTFIVQPNITKASGSCEGTKANLTLFFKEGFITFLFIKSTDNTTTYVDTVSLNLTYAFVKGKKESFPAKNNTLHLFSAKVGHCYSCRQTEQVLVAKGLYLDVSQDQVQAFNLTKSKDFGLPDRCPADQPNYKVAIGVGVTLLVLIVIVVVAYLVTRKRRTDGYQAL